MATLQPLSRETHASQGWAPFPDYRFARHDMTCPLVVQELPKAMLSMVTAFTFQAQRFQLVGVHGLITDQSLYVLPDGRWLTRYVPAIYRLYPFRLAATPEGQDVLCIDTDSGLITDAPEGQRFFADDGTPSAALRKVLTFSEQWGQGQRKTQALCDQLHEAGLIQPWSVSVKLENDDQPTALKGLYCINETKLNQVDVSTLAALRNSGALVMAYSQLLSMGQLESLARLTRQRSEQIKDTHTSPENLDDVFDGEDDDLEFDFS